MERGDSVIILENSGPWDNEEFYGRVGAVSHTDYGSVAVAIDGKIMLCEPENVIMVSAVPLLLEALEDTIADYNTSFLADCEQFVNRTITRLQAAITAARGNDAK